MFIAALFIIARIWKQPRRPSADEWIRKLWYIYTTEYYSAINKNAFGQNWSLLYRVKEVRKKHQYSISSVQFSLSVVSDSL